MNIASQMSLIAYKRPNSQLLGRGEGKTQLPVLARGPKEKSQVLLLGEFTSRQVKVQKKGQKVEEEKES